MGHNEALEVFQNAQAALEVAAEDLLDRLILEAFPTATAVEIRGDWSEGTASLTLSKVLSGERVLWSEDGAVASGGWSDLYEIEGDVLVTIGDLGAYDYTSLTVRPVKRPARIVADEVRAKIAALTHELMDLLGEMPEAQDAYGLLEEWHDSYRHLYGYDVCERIDYRIEFVQTADNSADA